MADNELNKFLQDLPAGIKKEKVLDLPITHIKGITPKIQKTLENTLGVKTIADFAQKILTHSNVHLLKILGISENDLDKWQVIANYILKLVKGTLDLSLTMKIIVAGLDNAGKTALLNIITKRFNIANLKPTKEVNIQKLISGNVTFIIWDMGGQELYRKKYISSPERYFIDVQSLIFVIDVQDKKIYETSIQYLTKILDILESFSEFPDIFIFLHKADPQLYEELLPDIEKLETQIGEIFKNRDFEHRTLHTSIYNTGLTEANIGETLSNLFELTKTPDTPPDIVTSLQVIYDNLINFSYVVETKFQDFENRLNNIENLLSTSSKGEIGTIAPMKELASISEVKPPINPRQALIQEIKQLFRKKRVA